MTKIVHKAPARSEYGIGNRILPDRHAEKPLGGEIEAGYGIGNRLLPDAKVPTVAINQQWEKPAGSAPRQAHWEDDSYAWAMLGEPVEKVVVDGGRAALAAPRKKDPKAAAAALARAMAEPEGRVKIVQKDADSVDRPVRGARSVASSGRGGVSTQSGSSRGGSRLRGAGSAIADRRSFIP